MAYNFTDEEVIKGIEGSDGIVNNVAKRMGITWETAERLINRNDVTKAAFKTARENLLDDLENVAARLAKNGSENMVKFYLNTIGKKRGFTEKTEVEHSGEQKIVFVNDKLKKL